MTDKFFFPGFVGESASDELNKLNKSVNDHNANDFKMPNESIRYRIGEKSVLDRVGEFSSFNSKLVVAIVESDNCITVYSKDNDSLLRYVVDKHDRIGINHFHME
jgi:hypothetical protein